MKKYIVCVKDKTSYVGTIYRNSISLYEDKGDALEVDTLEEAELIRKLVIQRKPDKTYSIICTTVTMEVVG